MEKVKIIQVRPIYREGNQVMDIRIHFPHTKIKPGDFITLGMGENERGEERLTWSQWASKYIKKTIAENEAQRLVGLVQFPQEDKL